MKLRDWAFVVSAASAATLVYGALYEANNLVLERRTLLLPGWPEPLSGFKIALLADLHLRDEYSVRLSQRAVAMALDTSPDMVALVGDYVAYWKPESEGMLRQVLEPLLLMEGAAVAVPGNHDCWAGPVERLAPVFDSLNVRLLRNESWRHKGVTWVGIDSVVSEDDDVEAAFREAREAPRVVLWHEPDAVDHLPDGAALMLSGHSHGGQFRFPGGFTPMHTKMGRKYPRGFYPDAPTPLYVSRGIGTTGPPSRFNCPPEVSLLTLYPG